MEEHAVIKPDPAFFCQLELQPCPADVSSTPYVPPIKQRPSAVAALSIDITYTITTHGVKQFSKCSSYSVPPGYRFVLAGSPVSPPTPLDRSTAPMTGPSPGPAPGPGPVPPRLLTQTSPPTSPPFLPNFCARCSSQLQPTHLDLASSSASNSSEGSMPGFTPLQSPHPRPRSPQSAR